MIYHAIPRSQGVENGLKRAKQMVDFEWSPLKTIPSNLTYKKPDGKPVYIDSFIKPGLPQKGVEYSSARIVDKHVGFEVSLETYATALENPDSVLYTRNLHGTSGHGVGAYYGIVCSAFASYVHNMPKQIVCKCWPTYPGVSKVEMDMDNYPECLKNIELLDVVLNPRQHIAVVTDILTDVSGEVVGIEVSESTLPVCRRNVFNPDEFKAYWFDYGFEIYRNANIDKITYTPNPYSYVEGDEELISEEDIYGYSDAEYAFSFMCDYGNKANYALGEPVVISVFDEGIKALEVYDDSDNCTTYEVKDGKVIVEPKTPGIWFAEAENSYGEPEQITWFVFDCRVAIEKDVYRPGEPIRMTFSDATGQDRLTHYYVKNADHYKKYEGVFTEEEKQCGKTVIPGIEDEGTYYISVYSGSPYALYGSVEISFTVKGE